MNDLRKVAEKFKSKLSRIKCVAFDCDGILTTGHISFEGEEMGWNRSFHTLDGYGMKMLMEAGIKVGVITGGSSRGVKERFINNLALDFTYIGNEDKRAAYQKLLDTGLKDEEILYMGDEFFDLPLLRRCGFSATVRTASHEVMESVDYVAERMSGHGCAREVIDILRYARNITPKILEFDKK